jgi:hydrogenase maturation factor
MPDPGLQPKFDMSDWASMACTLDQEGCVVCSDAGIPLRVVEMDGADALCEDSAGARTRIAVELVAPVTLGEVLITHGGVAIGRIGASTGKERKEQGR